MPLAASSLAIPAEKEQSPQILAEALPPNARQPGVPYVSILHTVSGSKSGVCPLWTTWLRMIDG